MKNTKSFLSVMMLASCLIVSACSKGPKYETREVPVFPTTNLPDLIENKPGDAPVESVRLEKDTIAMYAGETTQIGISFLPARKEAPKCVYTSSNTNVATVDENGAITAVSNGSADISVSVEDGKVTENVKVYVYNSGLNPTKAKTVANKIKKAESTAEDCRIAEVKEFVQQDEYVAGNVKSYIREYTTLTASLDDAYFMVNETDVEAKTEGGTPTSSTFKYIFYTNADYDTYIYKSSGNAKNYMVVSTTSFIGVGTRFDALKAVMENFFTSGAGIMTKVLENSVGGYNSSGQNRISEFVDPGQFPPTRTGIGSNGDDSLYFREESIYTNQRSDAEWEENWGIPADARFDIGVYENYNYVNNYVANFDLTQTVSWNYKNISYATIFKKSDSVKTSNVKLEYPNKAEYTKVEDIFDL